MIISQNTTIELHNEKDANECAGGPSHRGWYTDSCGSDKVVGIIASLPNGRFVTGYRWAATGERVYLNGVFTDETEAARIANLHARVFAEAAREAAEEYENA